MTAISKIFGTVSKQLGFKGCGSTLFIEYESYFLTVNLQKSSHGEGFYINVAITYKQLLDSNTTELGSTTTYKKCLSTLPSHVDFRAENIPQAPYTQNDFDKLASHKDSNTIKDCLQKALEAVIDFTHKNHDRSTIRKLKEANIFPAIIMKSV
ncbi:DUF4304 domain-containing protein [Pseudomonas helleri]|uniref:DUF4304 domain-containing protein n=1 Tax=Pseudomonas helleri TaxID=1608996 RepID=A0A0J6I6U5_9PSED|nr:DUF4304 domain-containing protein [Pseudomonas helleri]KMN08042.1 hypothetical protein TU84_17630 [Pseudomonas helleri]MQT29624.1 DUF4304 domain-containing protein [Pseudomonas helleri]MQT48871.1 DUF4304 domain-containing protein [Pseudomonas helleri]